MSSATSSWSWSSGRFPADAEEDALVMLSDILPTGFECGVLNGKVQPGSTVAIVGAGPIGLAALLTAQFYSPAEIIMIDVDDNRLQISSRFGATTVINNKDGKAVEKIMKMTGGRGVDTAIEAVGVPASFVTCEDIVAQGGIIANIWRAWRQSGIASGAAVGPQHRHHDTARGYRHHADAAQDRAVAPDRSQETDYASLQARQDSGRVRHVRRRR
jgi:NADPH:quinone reductase-like Zn-dependent oxidoreductase